MIKRAVLLLLLLSLLLIIFTLGVNTVIAQGHDKIVVANSVIQPDYPFSLNFSSQITAGVNIVDVRLQYQVEQMSFARVISENKIDFNPARSINAEYSLNMLRFGQLPPGINISYWWVVKDAVGNKLITNPNQYTVTDNRHSWNTLNQEKIKLLWYGQSDNFGETLMSNAQSALIRLANATGATPDKIVNLSIYTSVRDLANSSIGASEWSGGYTLTNYNSILLLVRSGSMMDIDLSGISHELTHVIVGQVTYNPYNSLPFWLNEGLAMYIQYPNGLLPSQFSNPLVSAIKGNKLISLRSLSCPFSAYSDKAFLSYAESFSILSFLIDQYSSNRMLQFLDTFKQGSTYDGALIANYGFDMDGLFSQWQNWAVAKYSH